jgi:hypothetical protein
MTYYLHKYRGTYIFRIKVQIFVIAKYDQDPDPDPHWFGSLDPDSDLDPH